MFSFLASEDVLGIMFCVSALKFGCDLPVTHLLILLVAQISEVKWSEKRQHIPQPLGLFITLLRLMGWVYWCEIEAIVSFSQVLDQNWVHREAAHLMLFRGLQWSEQPSTKRDLPVFRFIVENPHHCLHSSPVENGYPDHSICPAGKKIFTRICDNVKKNLTVDLNSFA